MSGLMDQEFGSSDSEGEDFNPALHVDSDEDDQPVKRTAKRASPEQSPEPASDGEDDEKAPAEANSDDDIDDEDGPAAKDADDDDIDDEEEEEEEDDDEDGPQVRFPSYPSKLTRAGPAKAPKATPPAVHRRGS
jgi:hypothetical protein